MSSPERPRAADAFPLAFVALAAVVSVAGFRAVFVDWGFLTAAVAGGVVGTAIGAIAWWRRMLVGESIALSALAFVAVGGVVVGGPTPSAYSSFVDGLRNGWAELLSLTPPIEATAELSVLPFTLAWVAATIGVELLRRTELPALVSVGAIVSLSISVLLTAEDRAVALAQGAGVGLVTLAVGALAVSRRVSAVVPQPEPGAPVDPTPETSVARRVTRRDLLTGLIIVAVAGIAVFVGPRLPLAEANERFDLRDRTDPPWDPLQVPSPLVEIKASLRDERRDDLAFTVESSDRPTRFPLAVLGDFDGVVWNVRSAPGRDVAAEFRPISATPPPERIAGDPLTSPTDEIDARITIGELRGPWLPSAGWPTSLEVEDGLDDSTIRMNLGSGTLAMPSGLRAGQVIDASFRPRPELSDDELAGRSITPSTVEVDVAAVPPPIRNLAADVLEGADQGWEQVAAVRDRFRSDGFYDTSTEARPGHSYFRLAEFLADPDRLVGFEEQYAAAAAVVARIAQLPVRLAVGYSIPEQRYDDDVAAVRSDDIDAWLEVLVDDLGWVPVDVTPDRSREPSAEATGVSIEEVAVPSPPPPPQIPPSNDVFAGDEEDDENDDDEDDEDDDEPVAERGGLGLAARVLLALGGGIALVMLLLALVVVIKVRRRAKRRSLDDPAARVGAAWREILDRWDEAGLATDRAAMPGDTVRGIGEIDPSQDRDQLVGLRDVVHRAAFHPRPPNPADGDRAWQYHDRLVEALYSERSAIRRIGMRVDPRTLRSPDWERTGTRVTAPAGPSAPEDGTTT